MCVCYPEDPIWNRVKQVRFRKQIRTVEPKPKLTKQNGIKDLGIILVKHDGKNDGKMLHLGAIFKVPNLKGSTSCKNGR